jgi:hypothetical protein
MPPHVTGNPSFGLYIAIPTGHTSILGPTPHTYERRVALCNESFDCFSRHQILRMSWERFAKVCNRLRTGRGRCDRIACRAPRHKPSV